MISRTFVWMLDVDGLLLIIIVILRGVYVAGMSGIQLCVAVRVLLYAALQYDGGLGIRLCRVTRGLESLTKPALLAYEAISTCSN